MQNLTEILRRLRAEQVEFSLIGGLAAVHYGAGVYTQDVDVCARFSPENIRRIQRAIADLHPFFRMTQDRRAFELTEDMQERLRNLYLGTDAGILDCLSEVTGIGDFEEVSRRSVERVFPFGSCRILRLDALIEAKKAMGSSKDMLVAAQLSAIKERRDQKELF